MYDVWWGLNIIRFVLQTTKHRPIQMFIVCELWTYMHTGISTYNAYNISTSLFLLHPNIHFIIYLLRILYCERFRKWHYESLCRDDRLMARVDSNDSEYVGSDYYYVSESKIGRNSCSMLRCMVSDPCCIGGWWSIESATSLMLNRIGI